MSELMQSDASNAQQTPQQRLRDKLSALYGGEDNLKQIIDEANQNPHPDEDLENLNALSDEVTDPDEALKREMKERNRVDEQLVELNELVEQRWPSLIRFDTNGTDADGNTAWERPGFWRVRTLDEPHGLLTKTVKIQAPGEDRRRKWVENEDECGYWIPMAYDPLRGDPANFGLLLLADGNGVPLHQKELEAWQGSTFMLPTDNIRELFRLPVSYEHINRVLASLKSAMTEGTRLEAVVAEPPVLPVAAQSTPSQPTGPQEPAFVEYRNTNAEYSNADLELSDYPPQA